LPDPEVEWYEILVSVAGWSLIVATDGPLRDQNRIHAMNVVYWSKPTPPVLPKDLPTIYGFAADKIGRDQPIDYLEFGVAHGKSMREITQIFTAPAARFFGFDSFIGLPEKWLMHDVGAFSNQGHFPDSKYPPAKPGALELWPLKAA
jgi:hypothetical protein